LFSWVMRVGLSTSLAARRPEGGLSVSIFSGADDYADLVKCLQASGFARLFCGGARHFDAGGVR
jgi:hypothetical protein